MTERKIGVFVCHCGGNISDYVDVEAVRKAVENEPGVAVAKTHMFACSDASQQEMIDDIEKYALDGIVVASCSPTLHLFTFRAMAKRGKLNPFQYTQVNLREQCSWAHRDDVSQATVKGIQLLRSGIARTRLTRPLENIRIETKPSALVIGAGIAGLRAAVMLADLGLSVYLVEKASEIGGWSAKWGKVFPQGKDGRQLIDELKTEVSKRETITLFTDAEVFEKSGTIGDFSIGIKIAGKETITLNVGAIVVATGFDNYQPREEEFGYGDSKVITLPQFKEIVDKSSGKIVVDGKEIHNIAYIYCVGSRQSEEVDGGNTYCSRYCCTSAVYTAISAHETDPGLNQYHIYRDMRTYGKNEVFFEEAGRKGSVFVRYELENPPEIRREGEQLVVKVADMLDAGDIMEIPADLVVLVTGMVPRENKPLQSVLKLPLGKDGFFNEIHPKLRPVETVINGVFIAGTCQGPKTIAESVASSLAAVSKSAGLLLKGYAELEPFIASIDPDKCTWCGKCLEVCPYVAIDKTSHEKKEIAQVLSGLCKGGGACVPLCPENAIDIIGYTDNQVKDMIDALVKETANA